MLLAGISSLIIFPYAISHIFLSYRGANSLFNLTNLGSFFYKIKNYCSLIDTHIFHYGILPILVICILILIIAFIIKKAPSIRYK